MPFKPGQSGNPLGRAKHVDPRSKDLEVFCREHRQDIKKVGEIVLRRAVENEEPWAIKLCLEYFYTKPGTFVTVSKEENTEVNFNVNNALSYEDQQTFLRLWQKSKKGNKAFYTTNNEEKQSIDCLDEVNDEKEVELIGVTV